jgi:hypothetical protein
LIALAVVLAVIAVLFAIAGVIYLTKNAGAIPSFLPGRKVGDVTGKHTLRGIGALVVAVALLVISAIAVTRGKVKVPAT